MKEKAEIPGTSGPITFTIKSDGNPVKDHYGVLSIMVEKMVNRIPYARIQISDGSVAKQDFEISASDDFLPGKEIEILAGYASEEAPVFKGIIVRHGIKILEHHTTYLEIECKDASVKLTKGRKNAIFEEQKDSEIMEQILDDAGIGHEVKATRFKHLEILQYHVSDWDFIITRAEINGMVVIAEDGVLHITKPDSSKSPALTVTYGDSVFEYEAIMDAEHQYSTVNSSAWDPSKQAVVTKEGESPGVAAPGNVDGASLSKVLDIKSFDLLHTGQVKDEELKAWADACFVKSDLSKIGGRVKFQGYAKVKVGDVMAIKGVGDRFNGHVYVAGLRHFIGDGNWETDVQFGLSSEWFAWKVDTMAKPASGLLPGICGLQIGTVTSNEGDPDGEERIKVKVPLVDPKAEGIWARWATPDGGKDRGIFFRPEKDDEVVLGFLNDDPRNAIVLGMLHSSKNPSPLKASDDNFKKGMITKTGIKLLFDDEKKSVTIETPGGNKLVMDDDQEKVSLEDISGNKIEMSSDGVLIDSAKDIQMKAAGDIRLEGTNVEQKASAELKAEGGSGTEVKSGATTVIKGSMVQIN